jgi:hypothetical protein
MTMVKASDYLGGKYVTATELPTDRHVVAVITDVTEETMLLTNDVKLVLALRNAAGKPWPRGVVLNKGNGQQLVAAFGDDTDDWIGKQVEIWGAPTTFGGRSVMGIRLVGIGDGAAPATANPVSGSPSRRAAINAEVPIEHYETGGDLDDEIPF